jgi:OTU domain-containing protein 6
MPDPIERLDALAKAHKREQGVLESSLKSLRPAARFGKQPSPAALASAEAAAGAQRAALEARHASEVEALMAQLALGDEPPPPPPAAALAAAGGDDGDDADEDAESAGEEAGAGAGAGGGGALDGKRKSRAERRRATKEAAAAAAEREAAAAAACAPPPGEAPREIENKTLRAQLTPLGLDIFAVPGDGHCLFRSVSDQLAQLGGGGGGSSADFFALRTRAADFIRAYWEEFAPFLPYEAGDGYPSETAAGLGGLVRAAVGRYCERMASSSCWGGHPELRALANVLGCPIVVYRAGAPPISFEPRGEETAPARARGARNSLRLAVHAHAYALGEHYNSVRVARRA